jgi:hypothetical protein
VSEFDFETKKPEREFSQLAAAPQIQALRIEDNPRSALN